MRNLGRILGIPTVLASTNAKINNLLNLSSTSRTGDAIWVNAIRKLPKSSIEAVMKVLNLHNYLIINEVIDAGTSVAETPKYAIDAEGLLDSFNVTYDVMNLESFKNLLALILKQSETCLPGIFFLIMNNLKEILESSELKNLNTRE